MKERIRERIRGSEQNGTNVVIRRKWKDPRRDLRKGKNS